MGFTPAGFPATGPPLGMYPEAPAALIVTEDLRLCSPKPRVGPMAALPFTIVGVPKTGTAGGIGPLPFTESVFPCCDAAPPTVAGEDVLLWPELSVPAFSTRWRSFERPYRRVEALSCHWSDPKGYALG